MKTRLLFLILILFNFSASAQLTDTLTLSVSEAEKVFLQNNLQLIAAHYNIDAGKELVKQARLWDNPLLLTDQNIYDGRFFRHTTLPNGTAYGEVYIQLQQLIRTAGKIHKQAEVASASLHMNEMQLNQVLHSLRYALHSDLLQVQYIKGVLQLYNTEIPQTEKLLNAMQAQLQAGNISQKDLLRIEALLISLKQESDDYRRQLLDVQNELKTILSIKNNVFIQTNLSRNFTSELLISPDSLLVLAKNNNPDYLLEKASLSYQQKNRVYQQSLRSPDLTVGLEYDKANSYVPNYYGLTVSLPLPVFNRNQGNIAAAGFNVLQQQTLLQAREEKLGNDIRAAYQKFRLGLDTWNSTNTGFMDQYENLMNNAFKAYQQRQMSLLDFTDLFAAYKDARIKHLQQYYNLQKSREDINSLTGVDVIQ